MILVLFSNNIDEVIRIVLKSFFIKNSYTHKKYKKKKQATFTQMFLYA